MVLKKYIHKIVNKLNWIKDDIVWVLLETQLIKSKKQENESFSIGVTTFLNRYESCLKPLIKRLAVFFPDCQIIVAANGHVKKEDQKGYILELKEFCGQFIHVTLLVNIEPVGLSNLWNQIIKASNYNKILIINDDVKIKMDFSKFVYCSKILNHKIGIINSSWSYFLISKSVINSIGWFDENLTEIGGEDDDYAARLALCKVPVSLFKTNTIGPKLNNRRKKLKYNSFGRDMTKEKGGYSTKNVDYLAKKWTTGQEFFNGAVEVPNRNPKFWKLNIQ